MAIESIDREGKKWYACSWCGKKHTDPVLADTCRDSHDLIYVQMSREDINRLLLFIMTKEDKLLTETLMKSLRKIDRKST